jgi:PqqD family protein of HPr-rel-A system
LIGTETRSGWRLVPGQSLNCREWDDEVVLFNDLSGATHLLSPVALSVLEMLGAAPAAEAALCAALERQADADAAIDPAQLAALLHDLRGLQLVEPC